MTLQKKRGRPVTIGASEDFHFRLRKKDADLLRLLGKRGMSAALREALDTYGRQAAIILAEDQARACPTS